MKADGTDGRRIEWQISVRRSFDTYVARVSGENVTASCTAGERFAVEAVAKKFCARQGLTQAGLEMKHRSLWLLTTDDAAKQGGAR